MEKVLTVQEYFLFVNLTSFTAILGALALWLGFILLGAIARRYELVYGVSTHWQFQIIAPAGIFAYLVMQSIASLRHQNMGTIELWTGYTLLVWSALLCLWGTYRFWRIIIGLAKEQH